MTLRSYAFNLVGHRTKNPSLVVIETEYEKGKVACRRILIQADDQTPESILLTVEAILPTLINQAGEDYRDSLIPKPASREMESDRPPLGRPKRAKAGGDESPSDPLQRQLGGWPGQEDPTTPY